MYKVRIEARARELAEEHGMSYGLSVLDGAFYVGPPEDLNRIGVPWASIITPIQATLCEAE